eukprot:INCI10902.1.p1 GENE.INCI10902.1~~INCI10902.1.p1  ORF type:complete len:196 (+),score=30.63 INCI10902.1:425-1012(+)
MSTSVAPSGGGGGARVGGVSCGTVSRSILVVGTRRMLNAGGHQSKCLIGNPMLNLRWAKCLQRKRNKGLLRTAPDSSGGLCRASDSDGAFQDTCNCLRNSDNLNRNAFIVDGFWSNDGDRFTSGAKVAQYMEFLNSDYWADAASRFQQLIRLNILDEDGTKRLQHGWTASANVKEVVSDKEEEKGGAPEVVFLAS